MSNGFRSNGSNGFDGFGVKRAPQTQLAPPLTPEQLEMEECREQARKLYDAAKEMRAKAAFLRAKCQPLKARRSLERAQLELERAEKMLACLEQPKHEPHYDDGRA